MKTERSIGERVRLGGIGHTLLFFISDFRAALTAAVIVVLVKWLSFMAHLTTKER